MKKIEAKIIADSVNPFGERITSFILTFPRFILAELNTHRMFSRNSASSRAVPFDKMLQIVQDDPFIPSSWMKDHKGMQGVEFFKDETYRIQGWHYDKKITDALRIDWLSARDEAIDIAKSMSDKGLTKQIVNRLLEPFMWHTAIVTATDYENFFALRAHDAAEIHFKELAYNMLSAYNESKPEYLNVGDWHIPFGDQLDTLRMKEIEPERLFSSDTMFSTLYDELSVKIATARCARVSYINFEGKDDYFADIKLYEQLLTAGHMSPFEHCAQALDQPDTVVGNFKGFLQLRKFLQNENRSDDRVTKQS